mgnify:CR=1 FL=1
MIVKLKRKTYLDSKFKAVVGGNEAVGKYMKKTSNDLEKQSESPASEETRIQKQAKKNHFGSRFDAW